MSPEVIALSLDMTSQEAIRILLTTVTDVLGFGFLFLLARHFLTELK